MVNLVEEWVALEDYAGDKQGFYQVLGDAEAVEIRVATRSTVRRIFLGRETTKNE